MARFSDDLLNRIKSDVSLVRLVEQSGVTLKPHGKDRIGHCPFHEDRTPSFVVSPASNLWHCLGACNTGGSVIDWVMKSQGLSFRHAVELLKNDALSLAAMDQPIKKTTTRKLNLLLSADEDTHPLLRQVIDYYHETLLTSPEALDYLKQRGLGDSELIKQFKLGYANRTLGYRLPEKNRKAGATLRGKLQGVGIYRESGHEHFNGSIVVPIFDSEGRIVEVYGRKIRHDLRQGTPLHTYLPGAHAGVWNGAGLAGFEEVILCEALLDAMTFWCAGYPNVTASYGTGGFTPDHLALFQSLGVQRVLIAYDRDAAGNQAAEHLANKLNAQGIRCYRILFPTGMDANAYALEVQPAHQSLGNVIRRAELMGDAPSPQQRLESERKPEKKATKKGSETAPSVSVVPDAPEPPSLAADPETLQVSPRLPASPEPPAPVEPVAPEVNDNEVVIQFGEAESSRRYRVRGWQKNTSYEVLKVNVLMQSGNAIHVDTFDLYSAKHRQQFARVAAVESGLEDKTVQRDLGQVLLQLEGVQDKAIQEALKPKEPTAYTMEETEREQALDLLRDPKLSQRIINDFARTGLVGEPMNALMGYLAAVSRKLKQPLAIIVQSTSAAGKSALMDAVLRLVPEEDQVIYSAMTGQSLFYLGETNLKHKILGISEEEGVRQAAYALKLLQSQGELTIASTGKDPKTGKLMTEQYHVEGPVMLLLTTTQIDLDEELLNRCIVLTINESREQTAAIQQRQRQSRTLAGLLAENDAEHLIQQHQNAQRLLRPLAVVNPYAEQLGFAHSRTRMRRDHQKYLSLIDVITLLHQYQREIKTVTHQGKVIEYVEATKADIALANQLAHDILGHSLDELPPPTQRLLACIHDLVAARQQSEGARQEEVRFTRRDVREAAGLSDKQVRVHLERLVELEYVYAHGGRNGQRFVYELVFDGQLKESKPQLAGLIDVDQLVETTTPDLVAPSSHLVPGLWRTGAQHGASLSHADMPTETSNTKGLAEVKENVVPKALLPGQNKTPSYRSHTSPVLAASSVEG